jgi:hypothetical protein
MKTTVLLFASALMTLAPAALMAQTAPGQGQDNGQGYNHFHDVSTGQPGADCEELIANGEGAFPGQSGDNGHAAFGGSAGDVYAGSQVQNSRNSASVSQYDVACLHQQPAG